tara:strand:+ start:4536 stop:5063 length:528 start_codon:yes stop_codon:yes gene_type:complete
METSFETIYCKGKITLNNNSDITINGEITDKLTDSQLYYVAPAPCDTMASFSGSGLPYPNKIQAFSNNPNQGKIGLKNNKFSIQLLRPNSYYKDFNTLELPYVLITYNKNKTIKVDLSFEKMSYRSLQYPALRQTQKEMFYARKLPIRSQEQILRDSEYDDLHEANDFWGLKPPI